MTETHFYDEAPIGHIPIEIAEIYLHYSIPMLAYFESSERKDFVFIVITYYLNSVTTTDRFCYKLSTLFGLNYGSICSMA